MNQNNKNTHKFSKPVSKLNFDNLHNETKTSAAAIICIMFSLLFILSLLGFAGRFGKYIPDIFGVWLGLCIWVIPFGLLVLAYILLRHEKYSSNTSTYFGAVLFVLSLSVALDLFYNKNNSSNILEVSQAGGYMGFILAYPMRELFGFPATIIIIISFLIISLLIVFNTSLKSLLLDNVFVNLCKRRSKKDFSDTNLEYFGLNSDQKNEPIYSVKKKTDISTFYFDNKKTSSVNPFQNILDPKENQTVTVKNVRLKQEFSFPVDLLDAREFKSPNIDIETGKAIIATTLSNFGIQVEMGVASVGARVTQYTLRPENGVKLSQITKLSSELALALSSHPIRIEAPIPGQALVGIEVPNHATTIVGLKEMLESVEFKKRKSNLTLVLGRDTAGNIVLDDLSSMPHLLVAGSTGAGKTVCLHSFIIALLYQNPKEHLRLILIDPKRVEMLIYNMIPNLLTPVIISINEATNALRWAVREMDKRFNLLSESGDVNITSYNQHHKNEPLPHLVIIIDELADLMLQAASDVEASIIRLTQMARAVGIHLIIATQRPSVDIITGLIKSNITSRVAFYVASQIDSRTVLDAPGAEKLLGKGDVLYISAGLSKPKRIQAPFISTGEMQKVADYIKLQGAPEYNDEVVNVKSTGSAVNTNAYDDDELLDDARKIVIQSGKASASLLQRRLRVGYARAARLLDLLEAEGIIGPANGAKSREIFVESEQDNEF